MAGIFPSGGTDPGNTQGAQIGVKIVALCKALFYRSNCNPRFDPVATNAMISELANAINLLRTYDCNRLDNLALVLQAIRNASGLDLKEPDANDTIQGVYDGAAGLATVASILALAPMLFPTAATVTSNDYLGFYNSENERNEKIKFSDFEKLISPEMGYTGSDKNNKVHPVWSYLIVDVGDGSDYAGAVRNQTYPVYLYPPGFGPGGHAGDDSYTINNYGTGDEYRLEGLWVARGSAGMFSNTNNDQTALFQRIPD
jgi:hypothetical protein